MSGPLLPMVLSLALPPVVHASYAMYALAVLLLAPPLLFILMARRGRELYIRRIPGIDAIEEAVGRATELGRPMMFSTGLTGLNALLYAVLGILRYIAGKAASYGCRLIIPQNDYEVMPIVEETAREAFRAAGRLDRFNPQDVRFLSPSQFAFASGYMGIAHRERAASCFLFGFFAAESLILAEAGQQVGAMQVAGTPTLTQIPFFLTSCDYTIIGEEVYAAGAYLSREPAQMGSVRGQDVAKLVVLALILVGVLSATWASVANRDTREGKELNNAFARTLYAQPGQKKVLARIEVADSYTPKGAPPRQDLEETLRASRERLADTARLVCGEMEGLAPELAALERTLRGALEHFAAGAGRGEAAAVAGRLKVIAEDTGKAAKSLRELTEKKLAEMEKAARGKARGRAVELFSPELKRLAHWVSRQTDPDVKESCGALVGRARKTLAEPASGAGEISRAMEAAREACCAAHFAEVRRNFGKARAAAGEKVPRFLLRTEAAFSDAVEARRKEIEMAGPQAVLEAERKAGGVLDAAARARASADGIRKKKAAIRAERAEEIGEQTCLVLDGSKSVSGRGRPLPLSRSWKVTALSDRTVVGEPRGPAARVAVPRPGLYRVDLKVGEQVPAKRMILGIDGEAATRVEHLRLTAGCELELSWRAAKDALPEGFKVSYEFRGLGVLKELRDEFVRRKAADPLKYAFKQPGRYALTVTVDYRRKPARDEAAEKRRRERAAAAEAAPRVREVRERLAVELGGLVESLNRLNKRLGVMEGGAKHYKQSLFDFDEKVLKARPELARRRAELTDANWPDRKAAAEIFKRAKELRKTVTASTKYLARLRAQAGILGTGKLKLPAEAEAAAKEKEKPGDGGEKAPAGARAVKNPAGPKLAGPVEKYVAAGEALACRLEASGGQGPYTFKVEGLPPGLSFDGKDAVTGLLAAPGPHEASVTITDSKGATGRGKLTLGVWREGWKRYRIYWTASAPLEDSASLEVVVDEAPVRPRPPWKEVPEKGNAKEPRP